MNSENFSISCVFTICYACLGELSIQGNFCSVCELAKVICTISSCSKERVNSEGYLRVETADSIRTHVPSLSSTFKIGKQEDASLFIISLLDHCAQCLSCDESTESFASRSETVIDKIFSIQLLSTIECSLCFNILTKKEYVYALSLEINEIDCLSDALAHFVADEIMVNDNAYRCSICHNLVSAKKNLTIHKSSPVLIINLKRSIIYGNRAKKLSHPISFNELLDISPYMNHEQIDSNKENRKNEKHDNYVYKLYAVICHHGHNIEEGHCWSYVRTSNDKWILVDDASYRHVQSSKVYNNPNAFVLFYGRISATIAKAGAASKHHSLRPLSKQNRSSPQSSCISDYSVK